MAFSGDWNSSIPTDEEKVYLAASRLRELKINFRERINGYIPIGGILEWPTETCPAGFQEVAAVGLAVASYPTLFSKIGYKFGGSGATFYTPDMRGIFPRGFIDGETGLDLDADNAVSCVGNISGTTITVTSGLAGCPRIGAEISGTGIPSDTKITALSSFDSEGIPGTITISQSATTGTGISITIDNNVNGSYGYDANKTHEHSMKDNKDGVRAVGTISPANTGTSGGAEARPKNTSAMYIMRSDEITSGTGLTNSWNETIPDDDLLSGLSEAGKVDDLIRQMMLDIRERIEKFCPVGIIFKWTSDLIPPGFMEMKMTSLLRSEYPVLFGKIGTMYGAADSLHFNIPDYRGRLIRGWNHGKSSGLYDPDAATRTAPTETGTISAGDHVGTEQDDENKEHSHVYNKSVYSLSNTGSIAFTDEYSDNTGSTGTENVPKNINLKYIIRTDGLDAIGDDYSYEREWDETNPTDVTRMGRIAQAIRQMKYDIEERILNMFVPGLVIWWPGDDSNIPDGYEKADGGELSRTGYSELWDYIGDMYGEGDGLTTFNKPDIRGLFVRAQDNGAGLDEGTRTDRGDGVTGDYVGTLEEDDIGSHYHSYKYYIRKLIWIGDMITSDLDGEFPHSGACYYSQNDYSNTSPIRAVDGHPKNIYLMPLIRTIGI